MEESKIPQTLIIADADKDILIIWFALITDNLTRLKAFLELAHRINMQIIDLFLFSTAVKGYV